MDLFDKQVQVNDVPDLTIDEALEEDEVDNEGAFGRHSLSQMRSAGGNGVVGDKPTTADNVPVGPTVELVADDNEKARQWNWPPYEYSSENIPFGAIENIRASLAEWQTKNKSREDKGIDPQWERAPCAHESNHNPLDTSENTGASQWRQLTNGNTADECDEDEPEWEWTILPHAILGALASHAQHSMNQLHDKVRGSCLVRIMCSIFAAVVLAYFWEGSRPSTRR